MSRWPRFLVGGLIFLLLVTVVAGAVLFIYNCQATQTALEELRPVLDAFRLVREHYVKEIEAGTLLEGALEGMLEGLNDPYTEYLPPQRYRELQIHTEGSYGGIGVVLTLRDGDLVVAEPPMPGSPAQEAGLRQGDQIVSINGVPATEITFDRAAELIRGPIGTKVTLGIKRDQQELEVTLVRDRIQLVTVRFQMLKEKEGIGYLRISMFNEHTGKEVESALTELSEEGMKGLILDLRGNPGGALGAAVEVAGLFLPKGEPILHIRGRDDKEQTIRAGGPKWPDLPLVVLVDGGSASASEIVAGALKDTGRGVLVGTRTFGKGSVQSIYKLSGGRGLKLTTALYVTSGGHSINGRGIEPDVVVEYDPETGADDQLEAAVEVLRGSL